MKIASAGLNWATVKLPPLNSATETFGRQGGRGSLSPLPLPKTINQALFRRTPDDVAGPLHDHAIAQASLDPITPSDKLALVSLNPQPLPPGPPPDDVAGPQHDHAIAQASLDPITPSDKLALVSLNPQPLPPAPSLERAALLKIVRF